MGKTWHIHVSCVTLCSSLFIAWIASCLCIIIIILVDVLFILAKSFKRSLNLHKIHKDLKKKRFLKPVIAV